MISNHEQCFPKMTRLRFILSSIQTTKTECKKWGGINRDSTGVQAPLLRGQNWLWTSSKVRKLPRGDSSPWDLCLPAPSL